MHKLNMIQQLTIYKTIDMVAAGQCLFDQKT